MGVENLQYSLQFFPLDQRRRYLVDFSLPLVLFGPQLLHQAPLGHVLLQQSYVLVFVDSLSFGYLLCFSFESFQLFVELLKLMKFILK